MTRLSRNYKDLDERPDGFPPFPTNEGGAVVVHQGYVVELFEQSSKCSNNLTDKIEKFSAAFQSATRFVEAK